LAAARELGLNVSAISDAAVADAVRLAKAKAWEGQLSSLQELSEEAATALAGFEGKGLGISGTPLSDRAVRALAGFRGASLYLVVPRLSDESVRALAAFKGDSLSLAGLVEPSAELARLLPEFTCKNVSLHPWEWNLGRSRPVTTADARLAAAYAARLGKTCVLPGITGFETPMAVEIATTLAASTGSLSIPNLTRVSPRTLTALIGKGNIELPPVDVIELIPEPDGSFTDDFVVPENFPTRKRR
jgi:antitoxin CcdA